MGIVIGVALLILLILKQWVILGVIVGIVVIWFVLAGVFVALVGDDQRRDAQSQMAWWRFKEAHGACVCAQCKRRREQEKQARESS